MDRSAHPPPPTGDRHADAVAELRWAMRGAGLTASKLLVMPAVLSLPLVRAALDGLPEDLRPKAACETIADATRQMGNGVQARILRMALGIGYGGDAKNLTERRLEFIEAQTAGNKKSGVGQTTRTMYNVEQEMLEELVTHLGAPKQAAIRAPTPPATRQGVPRPPSAIESRASATKAGPWTAVSQDLTYRVRGHAGREMEVVSVVRATEDGLDGCWFTYSSSPSTPSRFVMKEGGIVADDQAVGTVGGRLVTIRWPRPIAVGETHRMRWDVQFLADDATDPWFAMQVGRPTEMLTVRISFDPADLPCRVWLIDGIAPRTEGGDPAGSTPLTIDAFGYVEATFVEPPVGWLYGIGWQWPEDAGP